MPQEFNDRDRCVEWLKCKQLGMRRSITLLGKEDDCLIIRTPITNENVRVHGTKEEIAWLHLYMVRNQMYTTR